MSTKVNNKNSLFGFVIVVTLIVVVVGIYGTYKSEENRIELNSKTTDKVSLQKQRDDGVYELSKNFNYYIVDESKMYGYELFSEIAKQDPRIDTYEEYVLWAKRMKETYPRLGTDKTKIEYGNRSMVDLRVDGTDDGIHFILEVDEYNGIYTVNEIRSYALKDKIDRKYDGNGCFLIAQENSQKTEDCPLW